MLRIENPDVVYRTEKEKYKAVADDIAILHERKQPVLVGTTSVEKSERLSGILQRQGVRHVVLNAKFHEREAEIVAQAGQLGMVTIATNMAGRGTDILLGGNAEFMARQELVNQETGAGDQCRQRARSIRWLRRDSSVSTIRGRSLKLPSRSGTSVYKVHAEAARSRITTGDRGRRALHFGHRAARVAAHR